MAGITEFKALNDKSSKNQIRDICILDDKFGLDKNLQNEDLIISASKDREKYYAMAKFRVTDNDLMEFNAWIKGKMPKNQTPRLRAQFDSDKEYEEYLYKYQQDHMSLMADPAVLKTDEKGRTFSMEKSKRTFSSKFSEVPEDAKRVVVLTSNPEQVQKILTMINDHGKTGHTFDIAIDYKDENQELVQWDGDGADRIYEIGIEDTKELNRKFSYGDRTEHEHEANEVLNKYGLHYDLVHWAKELSECKGAPKEYTQSVHKKLDSISDDIISKGGSRSEADCVMSAIHEIAEQMEERRSSKLFSKKIHQCPDTGKWFIEGVDIPFETEESAKIALATMVIKGEPSDLNPDLPDLGERTFSVYTDIPRSAQDAMLKVAQITYNECSEISDDKFDKFDQKLNDKFERGYCNIVTGLIGMGKISNQELLGRVGDQILDVYRASGTETSVLEDIADAIVKFIKSKGSNMGF